MVEFSTGAYLSTQVAVDTNYSDPQMQSVAGIPHRLTVLDLVMASVVAAAGFAAVAEVGAVGDYEAELTMAVTVDDGRGTAGEEMGLTAEPRTHTRQSVGRS